MRQAFFPERGLLAEQAAHRCLTGQTLSSVLARLRLVTTAELLCPSAPPQTVLDLCGELEILCDAVQAVVRRRPGWLYSSFPEKAPVRVRRRLLYAAILCALRGALLTQRPATLLCEVLPDSVLLQLRGGLPGDAPLLLRRLAQEANGVAVFSSGPFLSAALRLPRIPDQPVCAPPSEKELIRDRFSLPYLYLSGFCAEP